jgi:hypothetical protein
LYAYTLPLGGYSFYMKPVAVFFLTFSRGLTPGCEQTCNIPMKIYLGFYCGQSPRSRSLIIDYRNTDGALFSNTGARQKVKWRIRRLASDAHSPRRNHESQAGVSRYQAVRMRRKCTKAGCGNNSTGHETLERRLVQLLVIARDIQSVLHSTTSGFTERRTETLRCVVPTRRV